MKASSYLYFVLFACLAFVGCEKDNYDAPTSMLTGRVVYQGEPVGLRSGGVELELWQHGYDLFSKIPVYVNQDGSFSARLFDGNYKLVLLRGNGPWVDNTDSIDVNLRGTASIDVPIDPYFVITDESFQQHGDEIIGTFTIRQVNSSRQLERVAIYLGQTIIVDQNNHAARSELVAGDITDLSQSIRINVSIPAALASKGYLFARIGVKASGVAEYLYTQPAKITL
ncbi:DUF3823 domain-containing protein [Parapedobacter sp. ISTM3]|uniref:DUF3823 domain-containing protein n=1 Tax=Parapedobacter sp. ISTM3 TaxID=2800130 RepID=UPI0019060A69|nr:DUF3823 domain-containing protein [Parapedobacter sp. ISTM3]MBK1441355.1 DUF3823 domain-containing protein [Parapedobacter sp. ISTM3]